MGIQDRDYYRKEGPSYLDSFALRGQATKWIIFTTVGVFLLQILSRVRLGQGWAPGFVTEWFSLIPERVLAGEVWRLVTYAFLHSETSLTHIIFNMWMLWMFGGDLEAIYGRWEFLAFYLVTALVGGLAFLAEALVRGNGHLFSVCIGASGAVMGSLILCAFYHPRKMILLFFVLPTPIWALAILHVVQDTLGLLSGTPGTAFSVHLGGAAFGAFYFHSKIRILRLVRLGDWFRSWRIRWSRPRLRVYQPDDVEREPVPAYTGPDIDEQLEAKVDAVLEKLNRSGRESLSEAERELLVRASEIYKRRRT